MKKLMSLCLIVSLLFGTITPGFAKKTDSSSSITTTSVSYDAETMDKDDKWWKGSVKTDVIVMEDQPYYQYPNVKTVNYAYEGLYGYNMIYGDYKFPSAKFVSTNGRYFDKIKSGETTEYIADIYTEALVGDDYRGTGRPEHYPKSVNRMFIYVAASNNDEVELWEVKLTQEDLEDLYGSDIPQDLIDTVNKIDELPEVDELVDGDGPLIEEVREMYDDLTDFEKEYVHNYDTLTRIEDTYETVKETREDWGLAYADMNLIDQGYLKEQYFDVSIYPMHDERWTNQNLIYQVKIGDTKLTPATHSYRVKNDTEPESESVFFRSVTGTDGMAKKAWGYFVPEVEGQIKFYSGADGGTIIQMYMGGPENVMDPEFDILANMTDAYNVFRIQGTKWKYSSVFEVEEGRPYPYYLRYMNHGGGAHLETRYSVYENGIWSSYQRIPADWFYPSTAEYFGSEEVNKLELEKLIDRANELTEEYESGTDYKEVPPTIHEETVDDTAKNDVIYRDVDAKQEDVDAAVDELNDTIEKFIEAIIKEYNFALNFETHQNSEYIRLEFEKDKTKKVTQYEFILKTKGVTPEIEETYKIANYVGDWSGDVKEYKLTVNGKKLVMTMEKQTSGRVNYTIDIPATEIIESGTNEVDVKIKAYELEEYKAEKDKTAKIYEKPKSLTYSEVGSSVTFYGPERPNNDAFLILAEGKTSSEPSLYYYIASALSSDITVNKDNLKMSAINKTEIYRVALDGNGNPDYTKGMSIPFTPPTKIEAPNIDDLVATNLAGEYSLRWDSIDGVDNYEIFVGTSEDIATMVRLNGDDTTTNTFNTDAIPEDGRKRYFVVKGKMSSGIFKYSGYSNVASAIGVTGVTVEQYGIRTLIPGEMTNYVASSISDKSDGVYEFTFPTKYLKFADAKGVLWEDGEYDKPEEGNELTPGAGTTTDPHRIRTIADFKKVGTGVDGFTPSASYVQVNDLDFTGEQEKWKGKDFSGTYDGNGHSVDNIKITSNDGAAGLFKELDGATIKNLYINDAVVSMEPSTTIIEEVPVDHTVENNYGVVDALSYNFFYIKTGKGELYKYYPDDKLLTEKETIPTNIYDIATSRYGDLYGVKNGKGYKDIIGSSSGEYVANLSSSNNVNSLTTDYVGNLYYLEGYDLKVLDIVTKEISTITLGTNYRSIGDVVFYDGLLYLAGYDTNKNNEAHLVEIDLYTKETRILADNVPSNTYGIAAYDNKIYFCYGRSIKSVDISTLEQKSEVSSLKYNGKSINSIYGASQGNAFSLGSVIEEGNTDLSVARARKGMPDDDVENTAVPAGSTTKINGEYGFLNIKSSGEYTYAVDSTNTTIRALMGERTISEKFTVGVLSDETKVIANTILTITISNETNEQLEFLETEKTVYPTVDYGIGILAGKSSASDITNVFVTGIIDGKEHFDNMGGLIGISSGDTVSQVQVSTDIIDGNEYIGGFFGKSSGSSISNVRVYTNVSGKKYIGGYSGKDTSSMISNLYITGTVEGEENVGGLFGYVGYSSINYAASNLTKLTYEEKGGMSAGEHAGVSINNLYKTKKSDIENGNDKSLNEVSSGKTKEKQLTGTKTNKKPFSTFYQTKKWSYDSGNWNISPTELDQIDDTPTESETDDNTEQNGTFTVVFTENPNKADKTYKTFKDITPKDSNDKTTTAYHKIHNRVGFTMEALENDFIVPTVVYVDVSKITFNDDGDIIGKSKAEEVGIRLIPSLPDVGSNFKIKVDKEWELLVDDTAREYYGRDIDMLYTFTTNSEDVYDPKISLTLMENDVFRIKNPVILMKVNGESKVIEAEYVYKQHENKTDVEVVFIDKSINYGSSVLELEIKYDIVIKKQYDVVDLMPTAEGGGKLPDWMFPYVIEDVRYGNKVVYDGLGTDTEVQWNSDDVIRENREYKLDTGGFIFEFKNKEELPDSF